MDAHIGLERAQHQVIFYIHRKFVAAGVLRADQGVEIQFVKFSFERQGPRLVGVVDGKCAEADVVVGVRDVIEINAACQVFDAREILGRIRFFLILKAVFKPRQHIDAVTAVGQGRIGEKLVVELPVPAQGRDGVAPINPAFEAAASLLVFIAKDIRPQIGAEVQTVLIVDLVLQFGVQVVEIEPHLQVSTRCLVGTDEGPKNQIGISAPAGNEEGGFIIDNRPFQRQLGSDEPNGPFALEFLQVAFLHIDFYYR